MMPRSPLFGRRIHISGSISKCSSTATPDNVKAARELVKSLVTELARLGANFVVPVDDEPKRQSDGLPICFDWLVWETIRENMNSRPENALNPVAIAVMHHKTKSQIPEEYKAIWDKLRRSNIIHTESAGHWNMNSKRMEIQSKHGDILVVLGGSDGVKYLADLYHDAGKPVIPLNLPLCPSGKGAKHLYEIGTSSNKHKSFFKLAGNETSYSRLNRLGLSKSRPMENYVSELIKLLEDLEKLSAFAVRLLNNQSPDYPDVDKYFTDVVHPVVKDELGYRLVTIDKDHAHEHPRIDQEIFERLHRSSLVIADITGARPNCFLELGYAFGRDKHTIVTSRKDKDKEDQIPFDMSTYAYHPWNPGENPEEAKQSLLAHWQSVSKRPPLVPARTLTS